MRSTIARSNRPAAWGRLAVLAMAIASAGDSDAATFTVLNTSDSGPGSLRQAIANANAAAGLDTIAFAIPGSGVHTIVPLTALPAVTDAVVIDGTTQPGHAGSPVIELNGASAGSVADGLSISGDGVTVKALVVNGWSGSGIVLTGSGCAIQGNYIGTDAAGAAPLGNASHGVDVTGGNNNQIVGNVISGNGNMGLRLSVSNNDTVQGNLIGTNAAGTAPMGNGNQGLRLENSNLNLVGGAAPSLGNVIAGNGSFAVIVVSSNGNSILGNTIGADAAHSVAMTNNGGVHVDSGTGNRIQGNTILSRTAALGIDLSPAGNNLQGSPVLSSASSAGGTTWIAGTLTSAASTLFTVEYFADPACHASGGGAGEVLLGSASATTNAGGVAALSAALPVTVPVGWVVTATATDPGGNTSQFSACVAVTATAATTTALGSAPNPSVFGQPVTFTATVSSPGPAPAGTVTFLDGAASLGTGTLNPSGVATFTTSALAVGTHSTTASYAGDPGHSASSSAAMSQVVNQAGSATGLASSVNPSTVGQSVTFTATVAAVAPGAGTPTGTVSFLDGATSLGGATLSASGVATFTTSALTLGSHPITASYAGDSGFAANASSAAGQVVNSPADVSTGIPATGRTGLLILALLLGAGGAFTARRLG